MISAGLSCLSKIAVTSRPIRGSVSALTRSSTKELRVSPASKPIFASNHFRSFSQEAQPKETESKEATTPQEGAAKTDKDKEKDKFPGKDPRAVQINLPGGGRLHDWKFDYKNLVNASAWSKQNCQYLNIYQVPDYPASFSDITGYPLIPFDELPSAAKNIFPDDLSDFQTINEFAKYFDEHRTYKKDPTSLLSKLYNVVQDIIHPRNALLPRENPKSVHQSPWPKGEMLQTPNLPTKMVQGWINLFVYQILEQTGFLGNGLETTSSKKVDEAYATVLKIWVAKDLYKIVVTCLPDEVLYRGNEIMGFTQQDGKPSIDLTEEAIATIGGEAFVLASHNHRAGVKNVLNGQTQIVFKFSSNQFQLVKVAFPDTYFEDVEQTCLPLELAQVSVFPKTPLNMLDGRDRRQALSILYSISDAWRKKTTPNYPPPPPQPSISPEEPAVRAERLKREKAEREAAAKEAKEQATTGPLRLEAEKEGQTGTPSS